MRIGASSVLVIACVLIVGLSACGSGTGTTDGPIRVSDEVPTNQQMFACLLRAGLTPRLLDVDASAEVVSARAANGDLLIIGRLPGPEVAPKAIHAVVSRWHAAGLGGIVRGSTADGGRALVLVIGDAAVMGAVPSTSSEDVARRCASG